MCLAVYKPAKVRVDWDALAEGFRSNSHGAGFAVARGGALIVEKGFFTFDAFREAYLPYEADKSLIHFRLATHGERNKDNCHPFMVTPHLAMIHNGVLDICTQSEPHMSDTWHYVEYILKPMAALAEDWYSHVGLQFVGEQAIRGSKFLFLRADGDWHIWNQNSGHWNEDTWYSNRSYEKSIGFSVRGKGLPAAADVERVVERVYGDARDIADEYDPHFSDHYHDLTSKDQAVYEHLLDCGYDVAELDQMIEECGMNPLHDFVESMEYQEGGL
jgi:hypothetical protein